MTNTSTDHMHALWSWDHANRTWIMTTAGTEHDMHAAAARQAATATMHAMTATAFLVNDGQRPTMVPEECPGAYLVADTGTGALQVVRAGGTDTTADTDTNPSTAQTMRRVDRPSPTHKVWRWNPARHFYSHVASGTFEDMHDQARVHYAHAAAKQETGVALVVTPYHQDPIGEPNMVPGALIVPAAEPTSPPADPAFRRTAPGRTHWTTAQVRIVDLNTNDNDEVVLIDGEWVLVTHVFSERDDTTDGVRLRYSDDVLSQVDAALTGDGAEDATALVVAGRSGIAVHRFMWFDLITVQIPDTQ